MDKIALKAVETWNERPGASYETISVRPLTHTIWRRNLRRGPVA